MGMWFWAQILGGVGFSFLIASVFFRDRLRFLICDITGQIPIAIHYIMLDAPMGMALTLFYVAFDIFAFLRKDEDLTWRSFAVFYVSAIIIVACFYQGAWELFAGLGTLLAVASRQARCAQTRRLLIAASTTNWGIYGVLVHSYVQVPFSGGYALASLISYALDRRSRA